MHVQTLTRRFGTIMTLLALISLFQVAHAAQYDIVDLGEGTATAVNDLGHAITTLNYVAYFYDGESVVSIGEVGTGSIAGSDLNNNDEIVGTYRPTGYIYDTSVAYYNGISWAIIGKFDSEFASGSGINDSGIITGTYKPSGSGNRAYIYNITTEAFSDLPSYSDAQAINGDGWITGTDSFLSGYEKAYYYDGSNVIEIDAIGGSLGVLRGYGADINDFGDVVGKSRDAAYQMHAFLYCGAIVTDLGTLGGTTSEARAINNSGIIVGNSLDGDGQQRAFVYDGEISDLTSLVRNNDGWVLTDARDINNSGVIVGNGELFGTTHAFLLTPVAVESGSNSGGGGGSLTWFMLLALFIPLRKCNKW